MKNKTFFEYLAIANTERVHSQMIAWLFSDDFEAISKKDKNLLLKTFLSIDEEVEIVKITTEYNRLDILIETKGSLIAIENKITASANKGQLSTYEKDIKERAKSEEKKASFFLLSITGEIARDNEYWKSITYEKLLDALGKVKLIDGNHKVIIEEYIKYLEKVNKAFDEFIKNPQKFDFVFLEGSKKKSDKKASDYEDEISYFIASNQLETTFQRALMEHRMSKIPNFNNVYSINETRGIAVLDVFIVLDDVFIPQPQVEGKKAVFFLAIQGEATKFAFRLDGDVSFKKKDIEKYLPFIEKQKGSFGYGRFNAPKSNAYCSLTKRPSKWWWHLSQEEFNQMIWDEISNVENISKEVIYNISQQKLDK